MENAKRYILGVIMLLALIQGCYEDEGNYDYSPLPSIQINGMNTIYHPRRLLDSLIIPITVETEYTRGLFLTAERWITYQPWR